MQCCILAFGLLIFSNSSVLAQRTASRVGVPVTIENVVIVDESRSGLIDGMIKVTISDNNPQRSTYKLSYDFLAEGNNFVSEELTSVNNVITLTNARIGGYYNLKVIRTADNQASETASTFSVKNGPVDESDNGNTSNLQCSGTLSYTSCSGSSRSISNPTNNRGYNSDNDYSPCGFEVATNCTATQIGRWHCIDGNLSSPPTNLSYTITDYAGVGLTALQAARMNYILCNYNYNASNVANAVWYIAGTGGSNNSIAQAAIAAVTAPNGSENNIKFYKSSNGSYQDMIKWSCVTNTTVTLGNRVWYDVNNNGINDSEGGIANVTVRLYNDANNDNIADGAAIATEVTDIDGFYNFTGLAGGNYIVGVVIPQGYASSSVDGGDPDNNINLDDNGQVFVGTEVRGLAITLVPGAEPDGGGYENISYDFGFYQVPIPPCNLGGVNLGNLTNYLFVFTDGNDEAKWQSASKGYVGNVAIDGIQANETTSGSFAYAGTIYSNSSSLSNWQDIIDNNTGQAFSSLNQTSRLSGLESDFNNALAQIKALPVTTGYNNRSSISLNGLNTQNNIAETFVINVTSGFKCRSKINITGDASDIFIFRWDDDANFNNGFDGQVKFQSGGAIVPLGGLKASNFIHVAGNINASGGGY